MPDLQRAYTPDNPLMQIVEWEGQPYYTSQYFYQQYRIDSPHGGKYRQHSDFLRAIKSIDAYEEHLTTGAVIEIQWVSRTEQTKADSALVQKIKDLEDIFRLTGYRTLYLFNQTGQAMMSHRLDNEMSKQLSVAINTTVSRQASRKPIDTLTKMELVDRDVEASFRLVARFGITIEHIAQQEVVKLIEAEHGLNLHPLLLAAPAQDHIRDEERMFEPTDLSKELGWGSSKRDGMVMNQWLEALGWQVKKIGGGWEATPRGKPYSAPHAWTEHGKSGYNIKWRLAAVRQALGV